MATTQVPRLSTRKARWFSIALALLFPVAQIGLIIRPWPLSPMAEVAFAVIFLVAMALGLAVMIGTPGWRREAKGALDEREAIETARALSLSYRIMGLLLMAFTLWYGLATRGNSFGLPEPGSRLVVLLLINMLWLQLILPSAILAWNTPVDEED